MEADDRFIEALCTISDPYEMSRFISEMLTPTERRNIQMRWSLMERLLDGHTQRDVAAELSISLCKITRGAKILKDDTSVASRMIRRATDKAGELS